MPLNKRKPIKVDAEARRLEIASLGINMMKPDNSANID